MKVLVELNACLSVKELSPDSLVRNLNVCALLPVPCPSVVKVILLLVTVSEVLYRTTKELAVSFTLLASSPAAEAAPSRPAVIA